MLRGISYHSSISRWPILAVIERSVTGLGSAGWLTSRSTLVRRIASYKPSPHMFPACHAMGGKNSCAVPAIAQREDTIGELAPMDHLGRWGLA